MTAFNILDSRTATAQNIIYQPETVYQNVDTLRYDLCDYYRQTGAMATKPYETPYKIARILRQTISGALGHCILPTVVRAVLEGQDQTFDLEHVRGEQSPHAQYIESHPRMLFYTMSGEIVDGTKVKSSLGNPELCAIEDQVVTAFCGASEQVLADAAIGPLWEVFSDVHAFHLRRWLAWKKYDDDACNEAPTLALIDPADSWLASCASNAQFTIGLTRWHELRGHNVSEPNTALAHAAHAKRKSQMTQLAISMINNTYDPEAPNCPAESRKLQALLARNAMGSGLCAGRLKLKARPEDVAVCREYAAYTGYPLSVDEGFSFVDAMFAFVFKKFQTR